MKTAIAFIAGVLFAASYLVAYHEYTELEMRHATEVHRLKTQLEQAQQMINAVCVLDVERCKAMVEANR